MFSSRTETGFTVTQKQGLELIRIRVNSDLDTGVIEYNKTMVHSDPDTGVIDYNKNRGKSRTETAFS